MGIFDINMPTLYGALSRFLRLLAVVEADHGRTVQC